MLKCFSPFQLIYSIHLQKLHISTIELEKHVDQRKREFYYTVLFFDFGPLEIIPLLLTVANAYIHLSVFLMLACLIFRKTLRGFTW